MDLTQKVLAYQKGYWTWTDLWKDLFLAMDGFLHERSIDIDVATQVIGSLTPRLHSMVDSFIYQGKKFEAFLFTAIKYQLKTVYVERRKERDLENSWQLFSTSGCDFEQNPYDEASGDQSSPLEPDCSADASAQKELFLSLGTEQKRQLIIALKNCAVLEDRHCRILSCQLGLDLGWILNCRDELRDVTSARFDSYRSLRERERAMVFSLQCADLQEGEAHKKKRRLDIIRRNLEKMNPYPRHQDLAKILGIPKGTIDSSLFYARKQLQQLAKSK